MFHNIIKISILVIWYVFILIVIGPIIDHMFPKLDEDKTNIHIFIEFTCQLITICITLYVLYEKMFKLSHSFLRIKQIQGIDIIMDTLFAVLLIQTQDNLIGKLNYITSKHPFNYIQVVDEYTL